MMAVMIARYVSVVDRFLCQSSVAEMESFAIYDCYMFIKRHLWVYLLTKFASKKGYLQQKFSHVLVMINT